MREIKFRGLSKGFWEYGLPFFSNGTGLWKITLSDGWVPSYSNPDEGVSTIFKDVDANTISQYTGFKDCNGKEIYEGDILPTTDAGNVYVVWAEFKGRLQGFPKHLDELEMWGWCVKHSKLGLQPLDDSFYNEHNVLGNIYENPELINNL